MVLYELDLKVECHAIKKNSKNIFFNRRTGRRFITSSNSSKAKEASMVAELSRTRSEYEWLPISVPINAMFLFIFPKSKYFTKKGHRSKNLPDISNLYESPQDALTKAGIIVDDGIIMSHDRSRRLWGPDEDGYRIIIELTSFDEPEQSPI